MSQLVLSLYYIVALIISYILLKAYKRETTIGIKIGRVLMSIVFIILFYSVNLIVDQYRLVSVSNSICFILVDVMLVLLYDYFVEFLSMKEKVSGVFNIAMIIGVALDAVFLFENIFFETMAEYRLVSFYDSEIYLLAPKKIFYVHLLFQCLILAWICVVLIMKFLSLPRSYWKRYYLVILGLVIVVLGNMVHLNGVFHLGVDISVLTYGVLGILMYFNTFRYAPMINRNLTRNLILDYMEEPILLFNYDGRLSEASEDMKKILPPFCLTPRMKIHEFFDKSGIDAVKDITRNQNFACYFKVDDKTHNYDVSFSCMRDERNKIVGYMMLFHDVTQMHEANYALEQSITYDALTGLFNKQSFYTQLPQWEDDRYWPVSVCICNIDNLKRFNQQYSMGFGDELIRKLSICVKQHVGVDNYIAKVDEGDIVAMVENTGEEEATKIFENIRMQMAKVCEEEEVSIEYGIYTIENMDISIREAVEEARRSMRRKKMLKQASASSSIVDSLKQTLTESDFQTEEHVERTQKMAARLGKAMNLKSTEIAKLELLAVLHDIGKVAIPQNVLRKRGKLSEKERKIIEQHTVKGYRIAKSSPELADIAEGILAHHEKWDGSGYPNGWKEEEIPLLARIISAVDSHDVMVNDRPYHKAMSEKLAIEELRRCSGTQFDPYVIEVFTDLLEREELKE